jgi:hypothetical protein
MSLNENKHAIHHSRLYKDWLISCPTAEGILGFLVLRQGHPRNSSFVATRLYHPRNSSKQQSLLTEGHVAINLLVIGLSCLVVSVFFFKKKKSLRQKINLIPSTKSISTGKCTEVITYNQPRWWHAPIITKNYSIID